MKRTSEDNSLSGRETEILLLALDGLTDKEIAADLDLTLTTVRTYWERLRAKLGAVNKAQAIAKALRASHERASEQLRLSEERFRLVAETVPDLLFSATDFGISDYVNQRFSAYTGLPFFAGAVVDWRVSVHPKDLASAAGEWQAAGKLRKRFEQEIRLRGTDGSYRWFTVRADPLLDRNEKVYRWVGACSDVEEHRRTEAMQARAAHELDELVKQKSDELRHSKEEIEEFAYSIAHDLRGPLRSIVSAGRILTDEHSDALDCHAKELVAQAGRAATHLSTLIDDLLAFSRLGRRELRLEPLDLTSIVYKEISAMKRKNPGMKTQFVVPERLPVQGDAGLLRVAIRHLLDNAAKFTASQPSPTVEIGRADGSTIFIRDNGVGFDPRFTHRLFHLFERLHVEQEFPGNGLGLACVRKVVQRHGGQVWAEGTPGKGATFFFRLAAK